MKRKGTTNIRVSFETKTALEKCREYRRETHDDILARLLGLAGREEKQTQTKEVEALEVSTSSISEGSKARESEREKVANEIFEKLENAFETILGYDAKGEDVLCWENFVKVRDAIQRNKKETEKQTQTKEVEALEVSTSSISEGSS